MLDGSDRKDYVMIPLIIDLYPTFRYGSDVATPGEEDPISGVFQTAFDVDLTDLDDDIETVPAGYDVDTVDERFTAPTRGAK